MVALSTWLATICGFCAAMQNGEELSLFPVGTALRGSFEPVRLEHDSESNRNELQRSTVDRNVVVTRFDKGLGECNREADTSAGVPAEVVLSAAGKARSSHGRHIDARATDQVGRDANTGELEHDVTGRAHDVELGT